MEELFIPYEQALELRELGFKDKCIGICYVVNEHIRLIEEDEEGTVPLFQQAFGWCLKELPEYSIRVCYNNTGEVIVNGEVVSLFDNFEQLLNYLLQLIKLKRKYLQHD